MTQIPVIRTLVPASLLAHGYGSMRDPYEDVGQNNGRMTQRWVSLVWGLLGAGRKWDLLD